MRVSRGVGVVLVKKAARVPIVHVIKSSVKSHKNRCINSCCLEFPLPWVGLSSTLFFFTMGAWIFQLLLLFSFYSSFVTSTGSVSQVSFKQDSSTSSLKKSFWCQTAWKINFHSNSFNGKNPLAAVWAVLAKNKVQKKGSSIIKSELRRSRRQFMVSVILPKNKRFGRV